MDKDLIRAYFRAYRARITDLEAEVNSLSYSLYESDSASSRVSQDLRNARSEFADSLRDEQYERWSLEDRIKKIERAGRW